MSLEEFLKGYDLLVSTVTGAYIVAAAVVWRKGADLGNLRGAQETAINGIACKHDGKELVQVIAKITEEEPRLLMPPKRNTFFVKVSLLASLLGIIAVFHASFSQIYPEFASYVNAEVVLFVFVLLLGFWVMAGEYRYLAVITKFQPTGSSKKIQIKCSP